MQYIVLEKNFIFMVFLATELTLFRAMQLTISKKAADVHFTGMDCGRKSFKKANGRLLKDGHKAGG